MGMAELEAVKILPMLRACKQKDPVLSYSVDCWRFKLNGTPRSADLQFLFNESILILGDGSRKAIDALGRIFAKYFPDSSHQAFPGRDLTSRTLSGFRSDRGHKHS